MKILFLVASIFLGLELYSQIKVGQDIDGEFMEDKSGRSVCMPDRYTIAIGATENNGNGTKSGHVRIFKWNGTLWVQKGLDIDGEAPKDKSGWSISMPDSNTIAIGAQANEGNGNQSGHVRVYRWDGVNWIQKGQDIDGIAIGDRCGRSVSMPDSVTLAIGSYLNDGSGLDAGHVRVFKWNGNNWIQKGQDIEGENPGDWFGWSLAMPSPNVLAVGAIHNSDNGFDAGHVRVYAWNGVKWSQIGADIDGESINDWSGFSVSMPNSFHVAIGAIGNDGGFTDAGHVRIYYWNGNSWVQKGSDIDGESAEDFSGYSISMGDFNTIAIGAYGNDGSGSDAGHVRVYKWNGTAWILKISDIDGEYAGDYSGTSVSMPDSFYVAIGAVANSGNGSNSGHVRVFQCSYPLGAYNDQMLNSITLYPNPTKGKFVLNLGESSNTIIQIYSLLGEKVLEEEYLNTSNLEIELNLKGIFIIKAIDDTGNFYTNKILIK